MQLNQPSSSDTGVLSSWDGRVMNVVLNRPEKGNALSAGMVVAVHAAISQAQDGNASCFVLRANGRHFCTGFDLTGLAQENDESLLGRFVRIELMLQALVHASVPTVVVARGAVVGAGADLFASCALRMVDGDATFSFPGWKGFGIVLGSSRLATLVGSPRAQSWIESAERVGTDAAIAAGLATARFDGTLPGPPTDGSAGTTQTAILRRALYRDEGPHRMDALVRSAASPGLHARISRYVAITADKRGQAAAARSTD